MKLNNLIYKIKKIIRPYKMAIITVVISVLAAGSVSAVSSMGKNVINSEMDNIGLNGLSVIVYGTNAENLTDVKTYKNVQKIDGINNSTPVLYDYSKLIFNNGKSVDAMGWGIAKDAENIVSLNIVAGRMINDEDIDSSSYVCLVDENIAQTVYKRQNICGKTVNITIGGQSLNFEIIGTVKKGSSILNGLSGDVIPNFIYIPYTTMKNMSAKANFDHIIVKTAREANSAMDIQNQLIGLDSMYEDYTIKITDLAQQKSQINNIVNAAFMSLFLVSCVAVIVCSIAVGASVNTAVSVRQKDIGIKMSLGDSKFSITMEFLFSAIFSCIIGVVISMFIISAIYIFVNLVFNFKITFDISLIIISICGTVFLTTLFSLIPSYQAANLPPIKALNRE